MNVIFLVSISGIVWAMAGYPLFLLILSKIKKTENKMDYFYEPTVTVMVTAHNEEDVIRDKLDNLLNLDYPKEKIDYLIASDFSDDHTDAIVHTYIEEHPEARIRLYRAKEHKGKTNAQNEAQKLVESEILVMTDANAMMKSSAVRELTAAFSEDDIVYVTGRLKYGNLDAAETSKDEGTYWDLDLKLREIESRIQTVTAGNGAIYACRNKDYIAVGPMECHDLSMPVYYGIAGKRCVFNKNAVAYEKAGENDRDEFKRKVRMSRTILRDILPSVKILNVFKNKWFTFFYLGHRSFRYLLWFFHMAAFFSNLFSVIKKQNLWNVLAMGLQAAFWVNAFIGLKKKPKNHVISLAAYYGMTVLAQGKGVINCVTGKSKPVWDKAESTR